ncbi:MAG: hypothetical protein ABIH69_01650 [bacterium]|nr:hypothetical protein [Candidatus Margulisiibacteriota bacterium]
MSGTIFRLGQKNALCYVLTNPDIKPRGLSGIHNYPKLRQRIFAATEAAIEELNKNPLLLEKLNIHLRETGKIDFKAIKVAPTSSGKVFKFMRFERDQYMAICLDGEESALFSAKDAISANGLSAEMAFTMKGIEAQGVRALNNNELASVGSAVGRLLLGTEEVGFSVSVLKGRISVVDRRNRGITFLRRWLKITPKQL